jgi:quercetin dioxygenase-like cupin family protein
MDSEAPPPFRSFRDGFRWDGVVLSPYKEDGTAPFRAISRQELFKQPDLACELRYFEMAPGGHSTLERHEHAHAVMILRGEGHCLLGRAVRPVRAHDLIAIPSWTWHQFRASPAVPLGFLCMVNRDRDRPQLPTERELGEFRKDPALAAFLDGTPVAA